MGVQAAEHHCPSEHRLCLESVRSEPAANFNGPRERIEFLGRRNGFTAAFHFPRTTKDAFFGNPVLLVLQVQVALLAKPVEHHNCGLTIPTNVVVL